MLKKFLLATVVFSFMINLITVRSSNVYAEVKCYQNNSTVKIDCLFPAGADAPALKGGTIKITDGKCYQNGVGDQATAYEEITCPTTDKNPDDPPTCYTGVGVETDCGGIKPPDTGQEWRQPSSFENGRCYREMMIEEYKRLIGTDGDTMTIADTGTVWAEVKCSDNGATLEGADCIKAGICRDPDADKDKDKKEEPTCEDGFDFALSWAVCGILGWIDSGMEALISVVDSQLSVGSEELTTDEMKQAWTYFRNIASLMLVVIGLTMIIGQALSKE